MTVEVRRPGRFSVELGTVVLELTEHKVVGSCVVREQGVADGTTSVAAWWRKGARLVLKGRLLPGVAAEDALLAMEAALRLGNYVTVRLGRMVYHDARLIGYCMTEGTQLPEVVLTLLSEAGPEKEDV